MNPKLRSRIQRVSENIVGNIYAYHPHTPLTRPDGLDDGDRVEVIAEPVGKGKRRIVEVRKAYYGSGGNTFTVFMHDLANFVRSK